MVDQLLPAISTVLLRNPLGTMELRGDDLIAKHSTQWLTIYHREASRSEARSHIHIRTHELKSARIVEIDGRTPYMAFYPGLEPSAGKPPLAMTFHSFYDWANEGEPIVEHQQAYQRWVTAHGRQFILHAD
jgi:hypothetical protein